MLGDQVPIEDVIASVSNGPSGRNNASAEARVRKLEHRLTGGRPPVSPRNLSASRFNSMAPGIRETTTDSSQLVNPPATRRTRPTVSEDPASLGASGGASAGGFEMVVGPPGGAPTSSGDNPPGAQPKAKCAMQPPSASRKRRSTEPPQPVPTRKVSGRRGAPAPSGTPSASIQDPTAAPSANGHVTPGGLEGGTSSRQARTPPGAVGKKAAAQQQNNNIYKYFGPRSGSAGSPSHAPGIGGITAISESEATEDVPLPAAAERGPGDYEDGSSQRHPSGDAGSGAADAELAFRCAAAEAQVQQLRQQLAQAEAAALGQQQAATAAAAAQQAAEQDKARTTAELASVRQVAERRQGAAQALVARLAIDRANEQRGAAIMRLRADSSRLGTLMYQRHGPLGWRETWEDGQAFDELNTRLRVIADQKEAIAAAQKAVRKRLPPPERGTQNGGTGVVAAISPSPSSSPSSSSYIAPADYVARDEVFKVRVAALKREEDQLNREKEALEAQKLKHQRELKRVRDESGCRFHDRKVLNERYLMGNLLGKGGFSDVYLAVDLKEMREVAVKVHQLDPSWAEDRKASYVKHAVREYNIHKALSHPRVVALWDIFEIDGSSFATVLEVAAGGDLAWHLQQHKTLPEKEARVIAAQVAAGLAYINGPRHRIIHYDLKPANILFNSFGEVKITDFGLSKVAPEGMSAGGMELTSQGAGTYWYLPPECFETGGPAPPLITSKVDVWSLGVILYQMLYGRRPFGEGITQDRILNDQVMLNARSVEFPARPAVSQDAKDFIQRCLAYKASDRLDVETAAAHPYLALKRTPTTRAAAAKEAAALGATAPTTAPPI